MPPIKPPKPPGRPGYKPGKPPRVPSGVLPIYPTYTTQVINGVEYKTYLETDWHQVMTEDGISLYDLLQSIPLFDTAKGFYKYCGIIKNKPAISAMKQLNAMNAQSVGDVYLIETEMIDKGGFVCEAYVWLGNRIGWSYCGTTNRKKSVEQDLPDVVRLIPRYLGEPGQVLLVGKNGKSLVWGESLESVISEHNDDSTSHQDIRAKIDTKADKLAVYMDKLHMDNWTYNEEHDCYEYTYESEKLPINAYFDITAIAESIEDNKVIAEAGIYQGYQIETGHNVPSYAIFKSKNVPMDDITVCVKIFGTFQELEENN